ncbi:MAG: AAA family ATPase [Deltaproteobacteria bacterium]|nr:AAA family ATPase [Deltaproteobacteria bacterium]
MAASRSTPHRTDHAGIRAPRFRSVGARVRDLKQVEITPEFQHALDLIERHGQSVFVTGKAGTGKSTFLHYLREMTTKSTAVLAPTGVAALNVGGQTIHSFFRFPPTLIDPHSIRRLKNAKLFENLQMLIIDEVSMVRADVMDGIDSALRIQRDDMSTPFGGVQVVLCGDLFQLPPIVRDGEMKEFFDEHYGGPYFFFAKVFQELQPSSIELTTIYRQRDNAFIEVLNRIREHQLDAALFSLLNARIQRPGQLSADASFITLTSTNEAAYRKNRSMLDQINAKAYVYQANVTGLFEPSIYPTESLLELKRGARVMLLKNDPEKRWVNGTLARVFALDEKKVRVEVDGTAYEVEPETWENRQYRYHRDTNRIEEEVIGTFTQYPLRLAWAITIHKSQGQTFDNVFIDLGRGAFAHGQTYVALSRCTSLEGIIFSRPITARDVLFDERVYDYKRVFPRG